MSPPPVTCRPYRNDDADWWRVRELLVASHAATPPSWNWDIRHWDGTRFHSAVPRLSDAFAATVTVWEAADGRLVGVVHPEGEGGGEAFLELDPDFRHLQAAMLNRAEASLAAVRDGSLVLDLSTWDYDLPRRQLLAACGYRMLDRGIWLRRARFGSWAIPDAPVADGYRLRTTTPAAEDAARMAGLLNAAFNRSIHSAAEYATFMAESPSFRHDLNLVAVAPDGSFAAHVGVTLDETNRHGVFEPVCTHPDHGRRGLARALLFEGLRRLAALGAATVHVETGDAEAANAFYASCGYTEEYRAHTWRREWSVNS